MTDIFSDWNTTKVKMYMFDCIWLKRDLTNSKQYDYLHVLFHPKQAGGSVSLKAKDIMDPQKKNN